ncbi:hypothetical protein CAEBREN_07372 [Caenorhabditis brenneri]|uniref:Domain of unknown function WSN domain-containing protein n=1 Tax=Caenorhabditis brenneri TaxID=135651 RepID=G0MWW0_CAEBE|nr:hypothetical protein CAEBREN_07372 [Caenorhabditis brenneri]
MCLLKDTHKTFQKSYHPRLNKSSASAISPSKLWILLFVSLFPSQYLVAAGYVAHGVHKANVFEDPSQINPMDYARSRRDAAVFSTAVTNLQSLSRIASAITLQIGLMDKTLDSQLVLSELLRMGDVKPNEHTSLNPDAIETLVSQLVELPEIVAQTTPPNPVENQLVTLEDMREEAPKFKDFANVPGKGEYEESLKEVKELENLQTVVTLKKRVTALRGLFVSFTDENELYERQDFVFEDLEKLEDTAKAFNMKPIQEAKNILETSKFIDLLFREKEFREKTSSFDYEDSDIS